MAVAFHLAFPVSDLEQARAFYRDLLGCHMGRESPGHWIDFDFFGHQLSAHLRPGHDGSASDGLVDNEAVPIPHFGIVMPMDAWRALAERLLAIPELRWGIRPKTRFEGQAGEQSTMFVFDPSGNGLEFKGLADADTIFRT